ncbi:posterior protein-like [Dendropsophus ebraccatus]|uniref:posterior protein-like n=1 Tax=Dendropsophus ebraccatus TaxID=150705 RepID=UPI003832063D
MARSWGIDEYRAVTSQRILRNESALIDISEEAKDQGIEDSGSWIQQSFARLPGPLAAQLSLADMGDHCRGAKLRRKELQRILGGRDTRGENALRKSRFRQHDDPILFCNNHLTLYKSVYNCPDMSQDDASFLYSMANRCNVDYTTRIALRNAKSYERFINILRDWCEDSRDSYETSENISMVYRPKRRWYVRYCYRCGRPGHIKRFCNTPYIYPETEVHSLQQEIDSVQSEDEISSHVRHVRRWITGRLIM